MRHACRRFGIAMFVAAALLSVPGCSLRMADLESVNRSLTYVCWPRQDACAERSILIQPGMKLVFQASLLGPQKGTAVVPPVSRLEWIVPRDRFTTEDYFVIGHLLAASSRSRPVNDLTELQTIGAAVDELQFHSAISERLYQPIARSMVWQPTTRIPAPLQPTAMSLRQSVAEPIKHDFHSPLPNPAQLLFELNGITFSYGSGPAAFFNVNVPDVPSSSPWFRDATPVGARALVTVDVPVRLQRELVSRYVPVYTSFADLERALGVEVTGFRRSKDYLNGINLEGHALGLKRDEVIAADGYFTVWFSRWHRWAGLATTPALVTRLPKDELLVAPGDVIVIGHRRRATDDPGAR